MSVESISLPMTSIPYLGGCEKGKADKVSDCRKGIVINKTLRTGDHII